MSILIDRSDRTEVVEHHIAYSGSSAVRTADRTGKPSCGVRLSPPVGGGGRAVASPASPWGRHSVSLSFAMASSGGGGGTKGKSARRKISLPWFRQASTAGPALSRQHTIDTPSSFHKRLLSRQTTGQYSRYLLRNRIGAAVLLRGATRMLRHQTRPVAMATRLRGGVDTDRLAVPFSQTRQEIRPAHDRPIFRFLLSDFPLSTITTTSSYHLINNTTIATTSTIATHHHRRRSTTPTSTTTTTTTTTFQRTTTTPLPHYPLNSSNNKNHNNN
ncbi:unnamed protein product [Nesidiocoris tenuis]|uniref:Uncharacterized protein n=1 Tax=Nesidiocoris tenuis TaxID=355587 RepID=A0A6H5GCY4_9HEMI|nr:unnamed protein product [Nesidiocoris tenuis]